jgi:hypothetical protein
MKCAICSSSVILIGLILPAVLTRAGEDPRRKVKSAISHRCMLECVWLKERCDSAGAAGTACRDQLNLCGRGCMDPAAVQAVLDAKVADGWGESIKNAIEVCLPSGEHYFLDDLRCPDGKAPQARRIGSVGPRNPMPDDLPFQAAQMDPAHRLKKGETDYHIIDKYEVVCRKETRVLFFDMYHCGTPKPWKAPRGFTRPPRG